MPDDLWQPLTVALDHAGARGVTIPIWVRDDDAVAPTPALERLAGLSEAYGAPILLAVIPAPATPALADFVAAHPLLTPAQHGYSHTNHAAPGERARELGGLRSLADLHDDLARGADRLAAMFGSSLVPILVPPWNRIDDAVVAALPELGFEALSAFGPVAPNVDRLAILNADVDIIDWRNGRVCRPHAKLVEKIAALVAASIDRPHPIGLLTHHLVHDASAWDFLDACLSRLAAHPAVRLEGARALMSAARARA